MRKLLFVSAVALALLVGSRSDSALAAGTTITTLSTYAGDSSMVLDAAGNPVVAYRSALDARLKILHCNDPSCTGGGESVASPDSQPGQWPSIALDAAGNPVVSYYTTYFDKLKVLHCNDPYCTGGGESVTTPDPGVYLLESPTSLALDSLGRPVIAYSPPYEVRVMHCNDANCADVNESITVHDVYSSSPSLVLDALGYPVVAYYKNLSGNFSTGGLRVMHCSDPNCTSAFFASPEPVGITPSLRLDALGQPVMAYYTGSTTRDLKVMHCNDVNCSPLVPEVSTVVDSTGDVGNEPSLVLLEGDPVVTYRSATNAALKLLRCDDPNCTPGNFLAVSPDTAGVAGANSFLLIDGYGNPAVTYDAGSDLRLLRCGDTTCTASVGGLTELAEAAGGPGAGHPLWLLGLTAGALAAAAALATGLARRHIDGP